MAPQIDEFTEIFLPNVSKFGFSFEFEVVKKGFFPERWRRGEFLPVTNIEAGACEHGGRGQGD